MLIGKMSSDWVTKNRDFEDLSSEQKYLNLDEVMTILMSLSGQRLLDYRSPGKNRPCSK